MRKVFGLEKEKEKNAYQVILFENRKFCFLEQLKPGKNLSI
jgi:hypothetical protein